MMAQIIARKGRKEILEMFFRYPKREFTILELSKVAKLSYGSAHRAVNELEQIGLLQVKKIGASRVCMLNLRSPYLKTVRELIAAIKISPHKAAAEYFARKVSKLDVLACILFGSTAKETERPSSDVDILIISDKKNEPIINKIAGEVLERFRRRVTPLVLTEREYKRRLGYKQFFDEIKRYGEVLYARPNFKRS